MRSSQKRPAKVAGARGKRLGGDARLRAACSANEHTCFAACVAALAVYLTPVDIIQCLVGTKFGGVVLYRRAIVL